MILLFKDGSSHQHAFTTWSLPLHEEDAGNLPVYQFSLLLLVLSMGRHMLTYARLQTMSVPEAVTSEAQNHGGCGVFSCLFGFLSPPFLKKSETL